MDATNTTGPAVGAAELSYGQKAVGLTFNPSGDTNVQEVKQRFAAIIDKLDTLRKEQVAAGNSEAARLFSVAITEVQAAQMWAVKGITWKN